MNLFLSIIFEARTLMTCRCEPRHWISMVSSRMNSMSSPCVSSVVSLAVAWRIFLVCRMVSCTPLRRSCHLVFPSSSDQMPQPFSEGTKSESVPLKPLRRSLSIGRRQAAEERRQNVGVRSMAIFQQLSKMWKEQEARTDLLKRCLGFMESSKVRH